MDDIVKGQSLDAESRRALDLDTLSAILPVDRRDRLAQLLTDDDVATLKHLAREGMGENSLRALASDLAYLEGWAAVATGEPLPWPATEALALKFVAHHLWDPAQRESDPRHGMPAEVAQALRGEGLLRSDGDADDEGRVFLVGPPVEALREWLERADIGKGPIFRAIDRWEALEERALTPQSINLIVKRRCAMAGLEPREFSAHGLRAGYLTEAARQGVALQEAMQQSQHRSVQQAASYYNEAERAQGRATRLYLG